MPTPLDFRDFVREIQNPSAADTGVDTGGAVPNAIDDMGAYEYDPAAPPESN